MKKCYRCGKAHDPDSCWVKTAECYNCSKIGHLASRCKAPKKNQNRKESKSGKSQQNSENDVKNKSNMKKHTWVQNQPFDIQSMRKLSNSQMISKTI